MPGTPYILRSGPADSGNGVVEYRFRKLTPYDRAELLRRERSRQRAVAIQNLRDSGADKDEMFASLRDFEAKPATAEDFIDLFNSVIGKAEIIDLSLMELSMAGPGQPAWKYREDAEAARDFANAMPGGDLVELAAGLCNISLEPADEKVEVYGEGSDPNPPTGEKKT